MEGDAVIIEVGLNEAAARAQNPHVPYAPRECAADARRCAAAGAAVVHWHARDPVSGAQRLADAQLYGEALAAMPAADVLAYPSYPVESVAADQRWAHCWALHEQHGLELTPVDVGSVSVVLWDEEARRFLDAGANTATAVVENPLAGTLATLEQTYARAMRPSLGSFDVGHTRTAVLLAASGALRAPVFLKIFLSGAWVVGPSPSEAGLDFHLSQIPATLDVEWVLVPYALGDPALVERLCRHALRRGGGIRVGVGDTPTAQPDRSNVQLVEQAARWAEQEGRPLASAADVRRRLGLAPRERSDG